VRVTPLDQYIHSQVGPTLQPGEQICYFSTMRRQPGLFWQIVLIGGLLLVLMTKTYFAILTNRRLILIRTKAGFWGTPKQMNLGVEQYDVRNIKKVTTSGMGNNRSMTFQTDTSKLTLRISPWFKAVSGTKDFFEQVPNLINSGQLAHGQLPAPAGYGGAPQLQGAPQQQYGAPPQHQQYGAPPQQQQQYGAPPQQQQYGAPQQLGPGARVLVLAQDGQRYPGTVVQLQGEHCLCAMQNGQFWFPANNVAPA
jgi:hypothetical protein